MQYLRDSWLFQKASQKGTLIDLTDAVEIIDYQHHYPKSKGYDLEKEHNHELFDGYADIRDSNWKMTANFEIRYENG